MEDLNLLKRKLEREKLARKQAEQILEAKALELFRANDALTKLNEGLEDQIKQRTADLNIALERAEKAQKAEQQFLANMSHEIRTPLNAIIGMSHLLKKSDLDQKQKEYLDIVADSAGILKGLVSDILDMSKIDSGQAEANISTFDLGKSLGRLLKAFSIRAKEKALVLKSDLVENDKYFVQSDKQWLNQILINLLSNAIKFTSEGEIELTVKEVEKFEDSSTFFFEVSDTGIGMDQSEKEKVFSEFKQANSEISNKYGGTGLGLSIATKLVSLLGGNLEVESQKGKGSKFFFSLPLSYTSEKPITGDKIVEDRNLEFKNAKVLVVEDNLMNQKYIGTLLNSWGLKFDLAENGKLAIDKYQEKDFDLVFMDISMPVMDGYDSTKGIRALSKKQVPIIALTASNLLSKKELALQSGMSDFLAKPFTPDELLSVIHKNLNVEPKAESNSNTSFLFDESLDRENLNRLFGNDYQYAFEMFETYLSVIDQELSVLNQHDDMADDDKLRKQAHKIKPMFSLVGLTFISETCEKIESQSNGADHLIKSKLIKQLNQEIQSTKPIVEKELLKLKAIISK